MYQNADTHTPVSVARFRRKDFNIYGGFHWGHVTRVAVMPQQANLHRSCPTCFRGSWLVTIVSFRRRKIIQVRGRFEINLPSSYGNVLHASSSFPRRIGAPVPVLKHRDLSRGGPHSSGSPFFYKSVEEKRGEVALCLRAPADESPGKVKEERQHRKILHTLNSGWF